MSAARSLTRRIFVVLFVLSFCVMSCAAVAATAASFRVYESDAEELLLSQASTYARALEGKSQDEMRSFLDGLVFVDMRCTLVGSDGRVIYDNYMDPSQMENHSERDEIVAAKNNGQGAISRKSQTLGTDLLYAAALVDNGIVLRLGESRTSLASFLAGIALQLLLSLVVIFVVSLVAARLLTKMIVRPFREVDLTKPIENTTYSELDPFFERIDEQRRQLESNNLELARAVEMRREFAGNVSHEMKSPLQVIGGYAELMQNGIVAPEDIPRFAALIKDESESMRMLIDDVMMLSRLDERTDSMTDRVSLPEVVRRVAGKLEPAADKRSISVILRLADEVIVIGSEGLVEQMVFNLVDNAIKYNRDAGAVRVTVSSKDGRALLSVADEGPGVPVELRERIFERFFRVDSSRSRETGGTGLGLAIVKHVAESLGGEVRVADSVQGGADFRVSLPLADA